MVPGTHIWAVPPATASTMLVGSLRYTTRAFGTCWTRVARVDDPAAERGMWPIVVTVGVSLVTAWVLAGTIPVTISVAHEVSDGTVPVDALVTGVLLGADLTAARVVTHDASEGRPAALTALTIAHELVTVPVTSVATGLPGT